MPKLNGYIEVGFCSGYGDGDFAVKATVAKLSREQLDELKLATLSALRCAEDMWRTEQAKTAPVGAAALAKKGVE